MSSSTDKAVLIVVGVQVSTIVQIMLGFKFGYFNALLINVPINLFTFVLACKANRDTEA